MTDVVSFAAGTWHSAAVRADGSAWVWGSNGRSELCDGTTVNKSSPQKVTLPGSCKGHACGGRRQQHADSDRRRRALRLRRQPVRIARRGSAARHPATRADRVRHGAGRHCRRRAAATARTARTAAPCGSPARTATASSARPISQVRWAIRSDRACRSADRSRTKPLPTRLFIPPSGGASGCWTPRVQEDAFASPKFAGLREAVLAAENIVKSNKAYLETPVPVRFRSSVSAGPATGGAAIHIKAAPERTANRLRLWTGECGVIPQIDRVGGAIGQISIFFNRAGDSSSRRTVSGPSSPARPAGIRNTTTGSSSRKTAGCRGFRRRWPTSSTRRASAAATSSPSG